MKLDINKICKENRNIEIGKLSNDVINTLGLDCESREIYLWGARINEHCEKHKNEYSSSLAYYEAIENIPKIIKNPDYVGISKNNGNIQYIKKLTDYSLLVVKVAKGKEGLLFRTIYPITDGKLKTNIKNGNYRRIK